MEIVGLLVVWVEKIVVNVNIIMLVLDVRQELRIFLSIVQNYDSILGFIVITIGINLGDL